VTREAARLPGERLGRIGRWKGEDMAIEFPFTYVGGGYFRLASVPKGTSAPMLHGDQAVKFVTDAIENVCDEATIEAIRVEMASRVAEIERFFG
jgi:hypothetical protein